MEQTKNARKLLACFAVSAVMVASLGLAACSGGGSASSSAASSSTASASSSSAASESTSSAASSSSASESSSATAAPGEAGFNEVSIFEDEEVGWLNVSGVYFQAVPMTDGSSIEDKDIHLEADIAALANEYGFGVGDWVPYLTVGYEVTDADGATVAEGTFMPMSADDGPHYGANIAMPGQGTYNVKFTIQPPDDATEYLIHTDSETGPGAQGFADGTTWPLEVESEWDYVPVA